MSKTDKSVTSARKVLRRAIDRACIARGEAQWTNGYRTGRGSQQFNDPEDQRLYLKQVVQFKHCDRAEKSVDRAMANYARVIRLSCRPKTRAVKR